MDMSIAGFFVFLIILINSAFYIYIKLKIFLCYVLD